jgi:hypothetical protein
VEASVDDFEAFKKKKAAEKASEAQASKDEAAFDDAAKKMGWVDGLGFVGANNPKVKGFILGRAKKKKVDPSTLEKPKGMESHRAPATDKKPEEKKAPAKPPEKPKGFNRY